MVHNCHEQTNERTPVHKGSQWHGSGADSCGSTEGDGSTKSEKAFSTTDEEGEQSPLSYSSPPRPMKIARRGACSQA